MPELDLKGRIYNCHWYHHNLGVSGAVAVSMLKLKDAPVWTECTTWHHQVHIRKCEFIGEI